MSASPPLRLARATVFAAVCAILTSLGHFAASGMAMAPGTVLLGFAGVLSFAFALSGHERSLATILGGLLLGQFALHVLFAVDHGRHHGGGPPMVQDGDSGAGMTAAHVLAAVLSAWWLRRGERRAWWLARQAARVLVPPFLMSCGTHRLPERWIAVPPEPPVARPLTAVLRHVLVLRGPPVRSGALVGN